MSHHRLAPVRRVRCVWWLAEHAMTRIEASSAWHKRHPQADQATITFTDADLAIYAELIAFARKRAGKRLQARLALLEMP